MVNNIFKGLFLAVAICLVLVLYGIYRNLEQTNRFKVVQHTSGLSIYDTKQHKFYFHPTMHGFIDENKKRVKSIPR